MKKGEFISLLVAIIAVVASVTVPEIREFFRLDEVDEPTKIENKLGKPKKKEVEELPFENSQYRETGIENIKVKGECQFYFSYVKCDCVFVNSGLERSIAFKFSDSIAHDTNGVMGELGKIMFNNKIYVSNIDDDETIVLYLPKNIPSKASFHFPIDATTAKGISLIQLNTVDDGIMKIRNLPLELITAN